MVSHTIAVGLCCVLSFVGVAAAHIIPPDKLHPQAEAYRRCTFVLNLNPVRWELVRNDVEMIEHWLRKVDSAAAATFDEEYRAVLGGDDSAGMRPPDAPPDREHKRRAVFELCTRAVSRTLVASLEEAIRVAPDRERARQGLIEAQAAFAAFADTLPFLDPEGYRALGEAFLSASNAMGTDGLMGQGRAVSALVQLPECLHHGAGHHGACTARRSTQRANPQAPYLT